MIMMNYIDELCGALALVKTEMAFKGLKSIKARDIMKNVTKVGNHYYHEINSFKVPYVRIYKDGSYKVVLAVKYSKPINGKRTFAGEYTKESILNELSNGFNKIKIRGGFITIKGEHVDITA